MTISDIVRKQPIKTSIGAGVVFLASIFAYDATRPVQLIKTARVSSIEPACIGCTIDMAGEYGNMVSLCGMTEDVFVSRNLKSEFEKGDTVDMEVVKYFGDWNSYTATKVKVIAHSKQ